MKKNKIAVHIGTGSQLPREPGKLAVTDTDGKADDLAAKHIIVATGARARDLPFHTGRWQAHLDLSPRHGADRDAE